MKEQFEFVKNVSSDGLFYAITGKHTFKEWLFDAMYTFGEMVVDYADYAILLVMILMLLAMFGSKSAVKGIYWTFALYIITKGVGSYL